MNATITAQEVLGKTKQSLRINNSDHDTYLLELINEGARRISTQETLIVKNCTAEVDQNRFYLPADCKKLLAFRDFGSCYQGIFVDIPFFKQCGCNTQTFNSLRRILDINGRWAYFINPTPDGTQIEIAYEALNADCEGFMVINEEMEIAVNRYAAYQFAISYPERYNRLQIESWMNDYNLQAAKCRSLAVRKFDQQKDQIRATISTMVNSGLGVLAGSYTFYLSPTH